jgi:hypothetical protein
MREERTVLSSILCLLRRSYRNEIRGKATARLPFFFDQIFSKFVALKAPLELPFLSIILLGGNYKSSASVRVGVVNHAFVL